MGSNTEFDQQLEKATSEMIPQGQEDISLFLDLCDRIRGKEVPAKDAMRSLKKRLLHRNPNVQLLALKLCDVCVKNGGSLFLAEVASREFMDALVQLVNNQPTQTNPEVRQRILSLIQSWSTAFKAKPQLSYAVDTYQMLKQQGHQFPPLEHKTDAIMIDTQEAPEWTDSDVCERCRVLFSLTNRKHHCRSCGKTYCGQCTRNNIPLPKLAINKDVRVCDGCYFQVTGKTASNPVLALPSSIGAPAASVSKEEEELQRAIALSILEQEKSQKNSPAVVRRPKAKEVDEHQDPELAAAIAASLQDMKLKEEDYGGQQSARSPPRDRSPSASYYPTSASSSAVSGNYAAPQYPAPAAVNPAPTTAAPKKQSAVDSQSITLFHALMEKMDSDSTGASSQNILQDAELKTLHEMMIKMHPLLVKDIEECVEKHKQLMEVHDKLVGGVRVYDKLYEERLKAQRLTQQQQQLQQQQAKVQPAPVAYAQQPPTAYGQPQPTYTAQPHQQPPAQYYQQLPPSQPPVNHSQPPYANYPPYQQYAQPGAYYPAPAVQGQSQYYPAQPVPPVNTAPIAQPVQTHQQQPAPKPQEPLIEF